MAILEWCGQHPFLAFIGCLFVIAMANKFVRMVCVCVRGHPPCAACQLCDDDDE
jgi:hypothetical protein